MPRPAPYTERYNFLVLLRLSKNPKNTNLGAFCGMQVPDFITSKNIENIVFGLFRQSRYKWKAEGLSEWFQLLYETFNKIRFGRMIDFGKYVFVFDAP